MAALVQQLEQLKKQQEELEKKIHEEAETKKKLNNEASIERLEALVKPITETLDFVDPNNQYFGRVSKSLRTRVREGLKQAQLVYNSEIDQASHNSNSRAYPKPLRQNNDLEKEEIYVTLIGILKKQDERIKQLEQKINKMPYESWYGVSNS
jgi:hypothetical protein